MPRKNIGPRLAVGEAGNYEIRWSDNGRSKRASTWTKNLAEAQAALAEFITGERAAARGEHSVSDLIDLYLDGHVEANVTDKVRVRNGLDLVKAFFKHRDVKALGPQDCDEYEAARRAGKVEVRGKKRRGGSATIRFELTMLSTAIKNAVDNKRLARADMPTLTRPDAPPSNGTWVTPDDYRNRLLPTIPVRTKATRRPRLTRIYRFIMLAFHTAQRRAAIETLQWEQVDLDLRMIDFNEPGRPITKKRRPVVPINDDLLAVLKTAYAERLPGSKYVLDIRGSIRKTFDHWREKAGMPWLTRHTIRRTWATWAAIRGVSMTDIAAVLGDDVATVEKHYLKFSPGHLRRAVDNPVPQAIDRQSAA